ncbi:hypothetical protein AJ88_10805 [Mesorhizobium amorphae CCBAU 01583]|nr:hypothetical protein AJ88_10805 [Mesorhizobium amorphae CCBAU 01583]
MLEHLVERLAHAGGLHDLAADVGVEGDGPALGLHRSDRRQGDLGGAVGKQRRAHDMDVVGAGQHALCGGIDPDQAGSTVTDVEDKVPAAVGPVGDKGGARRVALVDRNRRHVGAQGPQPLDVQLAEIVLADRADQAGGLAERRSLADEDGGRAGRIGPSSGPGSRKLWPMRSAMISTRISPAETSFFISRNSSRRFAPV